MTKKQKEKIKELEKELRELKIIKKVTKGGCSKYIRERDNNECRICGSKEFPLEVHHLKPKGIGGINIKENMITLCKPCHMFMHCNPMLIQKSKKEHSENIKQSLDNLKESGKKLGRPTNSKDKKKRKISGYSDRWNFNE